MEGIHGTTSAAVKKRKMRMHGRKPDDISTALDDALKIVEVSVTTSIGDCVAIVGTLDTTAGDKMIDIADLYDMTAAGEAVGAMCPFVATAVRKKVSMIGICDTTVVGEEWAYIFSLLSGGAVGIVGVRDTTFATGENFIVDGVRIGAGEVFCKIGLRDIVGLSDTTAAGEVMSKLCLQVAADVEGAVGIVGVRDATVATGESLIVDGVRIGAGEVFCTVGLRDRTTASEDVDIVGLSDTTATGEAVSKLCLQVAAEVGDAVGDGDLCDMTVAGEIVGIMSLLAG